MSDGQEQILAAIDAAPVISRESGGIGVKTDSIGGESTGEVLKPADWGFDLDAMNAAWALVLMGSKAVMLHEKPDAPIEDRVRVVSIDAFKAWHLNKFTQVQDDGGKIKTTTHATRWLASKRRREYAGIEFAPGEGPMTAGYFNLWRGFACAPAAGGSYAVFRDHLLTNVCGGDKALFQWVFGWFAHLIQRPRERIGTALVLRGAMGSGKTKVGEVIGSLLPAHYFMVDDPRYVTGQFNAHMASCLLLQAEEAVWAGDKAAEGRLKGLVTSRFQMIEQKGIDPIRLENYVRLIMTSNEDWVVPAGKDERRFCVLDVAPHVAQNHDYFREMDAELDAGGRAALLHDLLAFDLDSINPRAIPRTGALLEQKLRSLDSVEGWWFQRLTDGAPTQNAETWPQYVSRPALHADYIAYSDKIGIKRRAMETEMGAKLAKLMPTLRGQPDQRWHDEDLNRRVRHYELPPLDEARAMFTEALGQQMDWNAGNEGEREQG